VAELPKDIGMIRRPTRERVKPRATEEVKTRRPGGEAPSDIYARFLELPVALVLVVLWLVGVVLLGLCGLTLYLVATILVHLFAGV
jgi:hypothetical protein